jgi:hypothetical protein
MFAFSYCQAAVWKGRPLARAEQKTVDNKRTDYTANQATGNGIGT